jgi:hypothetical protein
MESKAFNQSSNLNMTLDGPKVTLADSGDDSIDERFYHNFIKSIVQQADIFLNAGNIFLKSENPLQYDFSK